MRQDLRASTAIINPCLRGLSGSPTLAMNEKCSRLRKEGRKLYHLGFGESPFPVPGEVAKALAEHAHENHYLPVQGLGELREAVARYYAEHDGLAVRPEHVLIGPGSKILMYLLQLAYAGEAIIPTPTWVSYLPQARLTGKKAALVPTSFESGWKILPGQLEAAMKGCAGDVPPLLIINSPGNPTGISYSEREVKAIAEVAREHHLLVLSDEIYGGLHHSGEHVSFARHYPEGTVVCSGMSKVFGAGGWRLGTMAFPEGREALLRAVLVAAGETFSTTCAPVQHAAAVAFDDPRGTLAKETVQMRAILAALGRECAALLRDAGVRVHDADGGFYLFPDFGEHAARLAKRGITDAETLCARLLDETGVALLPGSAFLREKGELTARLAFVEFDGRKALDAALAGERIDWAFLERHCAPTLEAVRLIAGWLEKKAI